jgi:hypothetical protein
MSYKVLAVFEAGTLDKIAIIDRELCCIIEKVSLSMIGPISIIDPLPHLAIRFDDDNNPRVTDEFEDGTIRVRSGRKNTHLTQYVMTHKSGSSVSSISEDVS